MEMVFLSVVGLVIGIASAYAFLRSGLRTKLAVSAERIQNLEKRLAELQSAEQKLISGLEAKNAGFLALSQELSTSKAELAKERESAMEKVTLVQQSEQ